MFEEQRKRIFKQDYTSQDLHAWASLALLKQSEDSYTLLQMILRVKKTSKRTLLKMYHRWTRRESDSNLAALIPSIVSHPHFKEESITKALGKEDIVTDKGLLDNPHLTDPQICEIVHRSLSPSHKRHVRLALGGMSHPNVGLLTLEYLVADYNQTIDDNKYGGHTYITYPVAKDYLLKVAQNPHLSLKCLRTLSHFSKAEVRRHLPKHPQADTELLEDLGRDDSQIVRFEVYKVTEDLALKEKILNKPLCKKHIEYLVRERVFYSPESFNRALRDLENAS